MYSNLLCLLFLPAVLAHQLHADNTGSSALAAAQGGGYSKAVAADPPQKKYTIQENLDAMKLSIAEMRRYIHVVLVLLILCILFQAGTLIFFTKTRNGSEKMKNPPPPQPHVLKRTDHQEKRQPEAAPMRHEPLGNQNSAKAMTPHPEPQPDQTPKAAEEKAGVPPPPHDEPPAARQQEPAKGKADVPPPPTPPPSSPETQPQVPDGETEKIQPPHPPSQEPQAADAKVGDAQPQPAPPRPEQKAEEEKEHRPAVRAELPEECYTSLNEQLRSYDILPPLADVSSCLWKLKGRTLFNGAKILSDFGAKSYGGNISNVKEIEDTEQSDYWFIGDVHGDLPALLIALQQAGELSRKAGKAARFILLGDLVDRGEQSVETVVHFLKLAAESPGSFCMLAGNHDESLFADKETGAFQSKTQPCEFAKTLNLEHYKNWQKEDLKKFALEFITLVELCDRAVFFPDGLVAVHGGFPHTDIWDGKHGPTPKILKDLCTPLCLKDFSWLRISKSPMKIPNRTSLGCQFGYNDFKRFRSEMEKLLDEHPVTRMIRGHDHYDEDGYCYHKQYMDRILTLNTMSCRKGDEHTVAIAKWIPDEIPEVHIFRYNPASLKQPLPQTPPQENTPLPQNSARLAASAKTDGKNPAEQGKLFD